MNVTKLVLGCQSRNGEKFAQLAYKFGRHQSERKSTQVHPRPGRSESQVDSSFLVDVSFRFPLARA